MSSPTATVHAGAWHRLAHGAHDRIDAVLGVALAPFSVDFTHLDWGSQQDETWM